MKFRYCEKCRLLYDSGAFRCSICRSALGEADMKQREQYQKMGYRFQKPPGEQMLSDFLQDILDVDEKEQIRKQTENEDRINSDLKIRQRLKEDRRQALQKQQRERQEELKKARAQRDAAAGSQAGSGRNGSREGLPQSYAGQSASFAEPPDLCAEQPVPFAERPAVYEEQSPDKWVSEQLEALKLRKRTW